MLFCRIMLEISGIKSSSVLWLKKFSCQGYHSLHNASPLLFCLLFIQCCVVSIIHGAGFINFGMSFANY